MAKLMKSTLSILFFIFVFSITFIYAQKPTFRQIEWQKRETTAFLHFTVNTFTDKEWGDGTESEKLFDPKKFDARQWIRSLKEAGFKLAILTAKHHDGFCLWPSKYTSHSVKNSPWKNGHGDVVREVSQACKEYGIKFGFYLSPWDRHEATYGTDLYNDYYKNQLKELLSNYGEISEVWFDGAKGENAKSMQYDFIAYWNLVRTLQPKAVLFSDVGPDVRWVGNESGEAGETCWSTINTDGMSPGKADAKYLNVGDVNGNKWIPAETDVSIRPGWFWHEEENAKVRTAKNLVNLYYQSVGNNSLLLLNIPPNRDGLLYQNDIDTIKKFRAILNESFKNNLAKDKVNRKLTDKNLGSYITIKRNSPLIIQLGKIVTLDRALFQENITNGQHISEVMLEYWDKTDWKLVKKFTTIGFKKLLRFNTISTSKLKFTLLNSKGICQLSEVGFYKASKSE